MKSNYSIILCENHKIVNDPKEVIEIFNNFFVNVAKDIGDKNIKIDKAHPSINKIETNRTNKVQLFFQKSMFLWKFFSILSQGSFVFCMFPNFYQFFV
jgi:exoribonuclease II